MDRFRIKKKFLKNCFGVSFLLRNELALKSKSESGFELSVKKRVLRMVQTISDDMFDNNLLSSSSVVIIKDYR